LSGEDELREQLRAAEEEEKKRYAKDRAKAHENPLGEEHLRREIPKEMLRSEQVETNEQKEARQEENRKTSPDLQKNNGGVPPWFNFESQKGLSWRLNVQKRIRNYFLHGATYEWVLWKMKRDMGMLAETAKKIIDDVLEEEPEKEPEGRPKKKP
jgi:hypothetical protein